MIRKRVSDRVIGSIVRRRWMEKTSKKMQLLTGHCSWDARSLCQSESGAGAAITVNGQRVSHHWREQRSRFVDICGGFPKHRLRRYSGAWVPLTADSDRSWTPIPRQGGQRFRTKVDVHSCNSGHAFRSTWTPALLATGVIGPG